MALMLAKYLSEYQPRRIRSTSSLKVSLVRRFPSKMDIRAPRLERNDVHSGLRKALEGGIRRFGVVYHARHDHRRGAVFQQTHFLRASDGSVARMSSSRSATVHATQ